VFPPFRGLPEMPTTIMSIASDKKLAGKNITFFQLQNAVEKLVNK
jgi:hypothetical protein